MSIAMDESLSKLGSAEQEFQSTEELYFLGKASLEDLRAAWHKRDGARQAVAAHAPEATR